MRTKRWTVLTGLVVAAALAPLAAAQDDATKAKKGLFDEFPKAWFFHTKQDQIDRHEKLIGEKMPELKLTDWMNVGDDFKKDDLKAELEGKVIVVDFWATWCGPCLAAVPKNNKLVEKYKDEDVFFVGICGSGSGQDKMEATAKQHNMNYPIAKDSTLETAKAWEVMWWPTYAVVDKHGKLRAIGLKPDHVEAVVKKLLKEEGPKKKVVEATPIRKPAMESANDASDLPAEWLEGTPERREALAKIMGKPAPALAVENWINSDAMNLKDLKGKVVMLDFWATWCGPCIASVPHTNELYAAYKSEGLEIIGVCHPRGMEKMAATVKEHDIRYPVVMDPDGKTIATYQVDSFPDYYFIDRNGNLRIADARNGSIDEIIKMLLAEKAVASNN